MLFVKNTQSEKKSDIRKQLNSKQLQYQKGAPIPERKASIRNKMRYQKIHPISDTKSNARKEIQYQKMTSNARKEV